MILLDHLVWLANFAAINGYVWVFITGFSIFGVGRLVLVRRGGDVRLDELREERGLTFGLDRSRPVRDAARLLRAWLARVSLLLLLAAGVFGVLGLTEASPTYGYIHRHGASASAVIEDEYLTFTASDGLTYTLPYPFFTTPAYPDRRHFPSDGPVTVRYLESHPQAYVVDTTASG